MTAIVELIEPSYVGEDRIRLTLDDTSETVKAFDSVLINVDYAATLPEGVVPPLVMTVAAPTQGNFQERIFRRVPKTLTFRPREGGEHLVTLRECWHNRWVGILLVQVLGDRIQE